MIDNYLRYKKNPERKSRFELEAYSEPIYQNEFFIPAFKPFVYAGRNPHIKASNDRKSDLQISWNSRHISSVYFFDTTYAFGDVNKSDDLILIIYEYDTLEMFILKNQKFHLQGILDSFADKELNPEIEFFRLKAVNCIPQQDEKRA